MDANAIEKYNEIRYACKDIIEADKKYNVLDKAALYSIFEAKEENEWSHQFQRIEKLQEKCDELFTENQSLTRKVKRLEKKLDSKK